MTNLILETFKLNGALLASGDGLVGDLGLTSARWQVLGAIAYAPQPLPVAHLARNMGLSRQGVQRLVSEMVMGGLLRLEPNPHHRRAKLVCMTKTGRAAYDAAMVRQRPWAKALAHNLSDEDIETARTVLETLRARLAAQPSNGGSHDLEEHT